MTSKSQLRRHAVQQGKPVPDLSTATDLCRERLRDAGERTLSNVGFSVVGESAVAFGALLLDSATEIERLNRALSEASAWTDDDKPLPEDAAIHRAHPTVTGQHDTYQEALRLVGAKRSKFALVDLVNWLLVERDAASGREGQIEAPDPHLAALDYMTENARALGLSDDPPIPGATGAAT